VLCVGGAGVVRAGGYDARERVRCEEGLVWCVEGARK